MRYIQNYFTKPASTALALSGVILCTVGLSACSSGGSGDNGFQMAFCAPYISDDAVQEYGQSLYTAMPELAVNGQEPLFTSVIMGEAQSNDPQEVVLNDPMLSMGGTVKFTGMIAAGELDVILSDLDNAARNARSESFLPLEDVLSPEELSSLGDRLLSFELVEYDGDEAVPTGEMTAVCGISITGVQGLEAVFGSQEVGVFIAANSSNVDLAKDVLLSLAEMA